MSENRYLETWIVSLFSVAQALIVITLFASETTEYFVVAAIPPFGSVGMDVRYFAKVTDKSRQVSAAPLHTVPPPAAQVPNCFSEDVIPKGNIPLLSVLYLWMAVRRIVTSFVLWEFLVFETSPTGFKTAIAPIIKIAMIITEINNLF